jgi:hypothetical protein
VHVITPRAPLAPPRRRIEIPGRCPAHPWRPARRAPSRRPLSRWRRHLDTLNGTVQFHPTTGNVLFTGTGVAMHPSCCCDLCVCANCPDSIAPCCVRVVFNGVTVCDCVTNPSEGGSAFGIIAGSLGTHDLPQSFPNFCGYEQAAALTWASWAAVDSCDGPTFSESPVDINLARVSGGWDLEVIGSHAILFSGTVSEADCFAECEITNEVEGPCDGPVITVSGFGGSATIIPGGCA